MALVFFLAPYQVRAETAPPGTPIDYGDEQALATLVWQHAPDVVAARREAMVAGSEITRAHLYPNPRLDLGWNTIPIGRTTPPGLQDPIGNVPNYTAGLSELFELAKRGPRQAAAAAAFEASRSQAIAVFADRFFDLLRAVGRIATAQVRVALSDEQVQEGARLLELERARAQRGEVAGVFVDRSETEQARLVDARDAARTELEAERAECSALIAGPCPAFSSGDAARHFLQDGARAPLPTAWSSDIEERRPDLSALAQALRAADEQVTLAKRQAIPDVTLRFGYTYDTFVVAGNQRQSLGLGMEMPIPVLDHGQADLEAASAAVISAQRARASLKASGQATLESAARERELIDARRTQLQAALGTANQVRHSMEGAAQQGGMSQIEVLLARRRYQELLLEGAELEGAAYATSLKLRQTAALFPRPNGDRDREDRQG